MSVFETILDALGIRTMKWQCVTAIFCYLVILIQPTISSDETQWDALFRSVDLDMENFAR